MLSQRHQHYCDGSHLADEQKVYSIAVLLSLHLLDAEDQCLQGMLMWQTMARIHPAQQQHVVQMQLPEAVVSLLCS